MVCVTKFFRFVKVEKAVSVWIQGDEAKNGQEEELTDDDEIAED